MKKIYKFKDEMSPRDSKRKIKKQKRRQVPNLKADMYHTHKYSNSMDFSFQDS